MSENLRGGFFDSHCI